MGELKNLVHNYISEGMNRDKALRLAEISKNEYYYHQKGTKGGITASQKILKQEIVGQEFYACNSLVISEIINIKSDPDLRYGYRKMTYALQALGYIINHKKVYRLMKQNHLLEEIKKDQGKNYVRYRIVVPKGSLEVLEMDIKLVWVEDMKKYAQILTIIDTFTRVILHWRVGYNMKQAQVRAAWEHVIEHHLQPTDALNRGVHIEVRNDNGPQFSANSIQDFFKENQLEQVFTHPYTPQENGHVESFHSILSKHLNQTTFWSLSKLEADLTLFYEKYNNVRLHSSTAFLPPMLFQKAWDKGLVYREEMSEKKVVFKLSKPYYQTIREI